jgi:hypothetical protein
VGRDKFGQTGDRSFFSETVGSSFERARMLFNSLDFIFLFMPAVLAAFAAAVRLRSPTVTVLVLLVASQLFYGYGDHFKLRHHRFLLRREVPAHRRRPAPPRCQNFSAAAGA